MVINMPIFKKKLSVEEAKELLENILSSIIRASGTSFGDLLKDIAEKLGVPQIPINIPEPPDFPRTLAKVLIKGIRDERAYEALKEIKSILDKYKI